MAAGTVWVANSATTSSAFANGVRYVPIRDAQSDYIEFQFVASKTGDGRLAVNYSMSASEANNVRLRLDVLKLSPNDTPSTAATTGTAFTVSPGANVTMKEIDSDDSSDFTISGLTVGQVIYCKLSRLGADGADTHTGDMRIIEARVA